MTQETMIMMSSSYLMIALMLSLQVYVGLRTLLFGIVLPAEVQQDAAVRAIRRNYALLTSGLAVVIGGACFLWISHQPERSILSWTTAIILLMIASLFAVWISRISTQRLKAARGWQVFVQTKRAASLMVGRTHNSVLRSSWWYSAHVAVMALCVFFAIARWDTIPQSFAIHMGPNGFPDHYTYKSVRTVFMMNTVQVLVIALFVGYNLLISRSRTSLDPQDREGSLRKQLKLKKIHSITALGISLLGVANLGLLQAVMLYGWKLNLMFRYNISFLAVFFLTLIGVMLYLRFKGLDQQRDFPSQEERHWKWLGSIYVNPEDPALFVPDRYGFLWTINMANPISKIIAAATMAVLVTAAILVPIFGI